MMTLEKAAIILQNPKNYRSHQVEEAHQFAVKVFLMVTMLPGFTETRLRIRTLLDAENEE